MTKAKPRAAQYQTNVAERERRVRRAFDSTQPYWATFDESGGGYTIHSAANPTATFPTCDCMEEAVIAVERLMSEIA